MSIEKAHLRKLLRIFYAEPRERRRLLLEDIRTDISKETDARSDGGDFHGPFWADAKAHVAGTSNLREQAKIRIE